MIESADLSIQMENERRKGGLDDQDYADEKAIQTR